MDKVKLINPGLAIDDRGELMFSNEFDMSKIKRFYQITNHLNLFVRAWHGHQKEEKFNLVSSSDNFWVSQNMYKKWDFYSKTKDLNLYLYSNYDVNNFMKNNFKDDNNTISNTNIL